MKLADWFREAPDRERAERLAERCLAALAAAGGDANLEAHQRVVAALCARAPFFAPLLEQHPHWIEELAAADLRETLDHTALEAALARDLDPANAEAAATTLRTFKYRYLAQITLRELSPELLPLERSSDTLIALSALAEVLLGGALRVAELAVARAWGPPRFGAGAGGAAEPGFCILGLGKLGGEALNYSSDVDLVYLHGEVDAAASNAGGHSAGHYYGRVARELGALCTRATELGFLYRIDLDLRPEGAQGPLVLSEAALASYFEARADAWEKAAFAKARPVAGDLALGWRAIAAVAPMIYRNTMDRSAVQSIRDLLLRARAARAGHDGFFDVKHDRGGIRDIEFAVEALVLLHGGRMPSVRQRSTERALEALAEVRVLPQAAADTLRRGYRMMRRLENRIQMRDERQTHRLRLDAPSLEHWGRAMFWEGPDVGARFGRDLAALRAEVQRVTDEILPDGGSETVLDLFARYQPRLFAHGATRAMMEDLAAHWSRAIAASADPELALHNLDRFAEGIGERRFYYELLLDRPELVDRLAALFASSRFLSAILIGHPTLIEPVFADPEQLLWKREELRADLATLRARAEELEAELDALRRFHHRHVLNVGLLDVAERIPRAAAEGALTDVAELCVEAALEMAQRERNRRGAPDLVARGAFLVVGMGKLASRELSYGSDLDLIFLYDIEEPQPGEIAEAQNFFVRLAQQLITILQTQTREGRCYEIDPRLRPSGSQGSLVTSLSAFARYHEREGEAWERQALLRARPVAGPAELAKRFEELRRAVVGTPPEADLAAEIHHIRVRMERELAREAGSRRDFKLGRGGLLDVENAVQYLQLHFGSEHPELLQPERTETHLERLEELGLLCPSRAATLREGFEFLQRLASRVRIVENRSISDLDTERGGLDSLARRLGYRPGTRERDARRALLRDYDRHTEAVRKTYLEVLGLDES